MAKFTPGDPPTTASIINSYKPEQLVMANDNTTTKLQTVHGDDEYTALSKVASSKPKEQGVIKQGYKKPTSLPEVLGIAAPYAALFNPYTAAFSIGANIGNLYFPDKTPEQWQAEKEHEEYWKGNKWTPSELFGASAKASSFSEVSTIDYSKEFVKQQMVKMHDDSLDASIDGSDVNNNDYKVPESDRNDAVLKFLGGAYYTKDDLDATQHFAIPFVSMALLRAINKPLFNGVMAANFVYDAMYDPDKGTHDLEGLTKWNDTRKIINQGFDLGMIGMTRIASTGVSTTASKIAQGDVKGVFTAGLSVAKGAFTETKNILMGKKNKPNTVVEPLADIVTPHTTTVRTPTGTIVTPVTPVANTPKVQSWWDLYKKKWNEDSYLPASEWNPENMIKFKKNWNNPTGIFTGSPISKDASAPAKFIGGLNNVTPIPNIIKVGALTNALNKQEEQKSE